MYRQASTAMAWRGVIPKVPSDGKGAAPEAFAGRKFQCLPGCLRYPCYFSQGTVRYRLYLQYTITNQPNLDPAHSFHHQDKTPFSTDPAMSSQANSGIPLSHAPDGTGYKLLELPPELLELLESKDPPT